MSTADGRFTKVFNGEIFNLKELRRQLEKDGIAFRSTSDTEVLLELYAGAGTRYAQRFCRGCLPLPFGMISKKSLFWLAIL